MATPYENKNEEKRTPPRVKINFRNWLRFEPLRDDLRHYLEESPHGHFIRHPFCNTLITDLDRCAIIHHQIDERTAKADACFEAQDWEGYINVLERPHQPEFFAKDADLLPDEKYWRILREVHQSQRCTVGYRDLFDRLFRAERPGREYLMTEEERQVLAKLPDVLTVYRGYSTDDAYADGVAWTLDRRQALWFANVYREPFPMLATGKVAKADIWAYIEGGDVYLPSEAVNPRVDDDALDETFCRPWDEVMNPALDIKALFVK